MSDYEKLGAFYLGRTYDPDTQAVSSDPVLYDSKDLTTHAVCVGMTGSGKTGLGIALLEEALIDGIPVIAIDPKGDLSNLALTFPDLQPKDFEPWIDEGAAARKGRSVSEHAQATAASWKEGLAEWGQDGARIGRLRDAAETKIFTPGSSAGTPLSVLGSFTAPAPELLADGDALRERVATAVSGLLTLMGLDADPLRSKEHILVSMLLDGAWREGRDLDLPALIRGIQSPPFERVGVFDLESFFSEKERFGLAMALNNLIASPGFAAWTEGPPLDIASLLHSPTGKPRLSVLSIAHLSDSERMFFVTLVLSELIAWMRAQPGTQSLRCVLYMDEVFGYFPPTANPPSKTPMLTLLKQARAFGVGVVLATQNPVDLDYKGLSNAGTWFLGRLQTERDKARVLEGLKGASLGAGFDSARMERILSGLGSRVFVMNNVHEDEPVIFHTRWVLSYLAGPLTRTQLSALAAPTPADATTTAPGSPGAKGAGVAQPGAVKDVRAVETDEREVAVNRPVLPPGIEEKFLAVSKVGARDARLLYRPTLFAAATLHYANARLGVDHWVRTSILSRLPSDEPNDPWFEVTSLPERSELVDEPEAGASFADLPSYATKKANYKRWTKMLASNLYRERPLAVWRCKELKQVGRPGADEGAFRARLREVAREARDLDVEKLRAKYAPKFTRLQDQIRTAEERVARETSQYDQSKLQTAISLGSTMLGALFGRRSRSSAVSKATTAARGASRALRDRGDIGRAEARLVVLHEKVAKLELDLEEKLNDVRDSFEVDALDCELVEVKPRKSDISVDVLALVWAPWRIDSDGVAEPAFETAVDTTF